MSISARRRMSLITIRSFRIGPARDEGAEYREIGDEIAQVVGIANPIKSFEEVLGLYVRNQGQADLDQGPLSAATGM